MSSLYNDINKILSSATQLQGNHHIVEDYENRAQFERVRLFEAKRTLEKRAPSEEDIARAMVQLAATQSMTSAERNPRQAMVSSAQMYRTDDHLKESWQAMGKLVEVAHKEFDCDLQEMLGKYNDAQLDLLEMTLDLPWRLTYSEPVDVEVHDYAVPGQEHLFKGVEPEDTTEDEAEADVMEPDDAVPMESKVEKLRKHRKSLQETAGTVDDLWSNIYTMLSRGTYQILDRQSDKSRGVIKVREWMPGREYSDYTIEIRRG